MPLDKKQIPQLAVLGLLVLACITYVSFKVMGGKSPSATPTAAHKAMKAVDLAKTSPTDAVATVSEDATQTGVFPDLKSAPAKRDPFMLQKMPHSDEENGTQHNVIVVKNGGAKLPSIVSPVNPFGAKSNGAISVSKDNQEPQFTLTGVLRGTSNVVILRSGNNERHIVKQGQIVNGRYKVLFVTGDGAVLADKNRRIHFKLGGNKNLS